MDVESFTMKTAKYYPIRAERVIEMSQRTVILVFLLYKMGFSFPWIAFWKDTASFIQLSWHFWIISFLSCVIQANNCQTHSCQHFLLRRGHLWNWPRGSKNAGLKTIFVLIDILYSIFTLKLIYVLWMHCTSLKLAEFEKAACARWPQPIRGRQSASTNERPGL